MLIKNQIYEAEITDYTSEGQGIAHIEGCAVFVPNGIYGERCTVRIEKVGKTWAAGKIVEILEKSPHRVNRACPVAKLCGGCTFWHMDYEEELRAKAQRVKDAMNRIGGQALESVPITGSPAVTGYRNKAQYPVGLVRGKADAGFFRQRTHQVVPIRRCLIQSETADAARETVVQWMRQNGVSVYDETTGKGLVRHIYARTAMATGQVLVCLVINGDGIPNEKSLVDNLLKAVQNLNTVCLSIHKKQNSQY